MKTSTANAIKTLLRMDPTVTPDVRMAIIGAMMDGDGAASTIGTDKEVSIADAASYLGMSRTTLWRMCDRGELVSARRGKKFFISGFEVERLKKVS